MSEPPVAIVLAAGKGVRTGGRVPKQLMPLAGKPVMVHALEQHLRLGHRVVLVVSDDIRAEAETLLDSLDAADRVDVVPGGVTRRESVLAGIGALSADSPATTPVILRNAASPNTPDAVIAACVDGLATHDGMQAYFASEATTFVHDGSQLEFLVPRASTGFTCDPTVYRRETVDSIAREMESGAPGETTLDVARRLDASIGIVESPADNVKITTAEDLARVAVAMGAAAT